LLSIGLGAFAIWLSKRFDERSAAALDAIRDLARETRALIDVAVSQQRDFSTKMLDSILSRDPYGRTVAPPVQEGPSALEEVVRKQLTDTEHRISEAIEDTIRRLPAQPNSQRLEQAVASIRNDIKRLTDAAAARITVPVELPEKIAVAFNEWRDFPAHFLVLFAILREGATSVGRLRKVADRYGIPEPFDGGVENLLKAGVLEGTLSDFRVPSDIQNLLLAWIEANEPVLLEVASHFRNAPSKDNVDGEVR
jgi:hypothetical protein